MPHAGGTHVVSFVQEVGQVQQVGELNDTSIALDGRQIVEAGVELEVLATGESGVEATLTTGNQPDCGLDVTLVLIAEFVAANPGHARGREDECGEHLDQRRLPCAVGPDEAEDLSPSDANRDSVNGEGTLLTGEGEGQAC
jgi:hypothetical protein